MLRVSFSNTINTDAYVESSRIGWYVFGQVLMVILLYLQMSNSVRQHKILGMHKETT